MIRFTLLALLVYVSHSKKSGINNYLNKGQNPNDINDGNSWEPDTMPESNFDYNQYSNQYNEDVNAPYSNRNPQYNPDYDNQQKSQSPQRIPKESPKKNVVARYTETIPSKLLVAICSAVFIYSISILLMHFILSHAPQYIALILTAVGMIATFIPGEIGSFSKSSGVFVILLAQRSSLHKFFTRFFKQLFAACMLIRRVSFPTAKDPWKYRPQYEDDIEFNMTSVLIASAILGAFGGWFIGKSIPFFPTWIGTLGGAGFNAYLSTFQDARGDFVRYVSHSTKEAFDEIMTASKEVGLTDEASILLSRTLSVLNTLDQQFHIIPKIKAMLTFIAAKLAFIFTRMKQDMEDRKSSE